MTSPQIEELIARLEAATGPDRELDRDLVALFHAGEPLQWPDQYKATAEHWAKRPVEHLTASIDAALALCEQVRPGYDWILEHTNGGLTISCLFGTADHDKRTFGATPPLAILLAFLRSLQDTPLND